MILVAVPDTVFANGPTCCDVTGKAAIKVGHGIRVLFGDGEQAFSEFLSHIQGYSVAILLVTWKQKVKEIEMGINRTAFLKM